MRPTKHELYNLFYRAGEERDREAVARLLELRLLRPVPCPDPSSETQPFACIEATDGSRACYETTEGTLAWDMHFPPKLKQHRERPQYSRKTILRALLLYQRYQESGLDRGSDAQVAAVCKRIDAWFAFNPLNELERKVVFLHYMQGLSQAETAKLIGKSQQTVSRYAREALEKMEGYINNFEPEETSEKICG